MSPFKTTEEKAAYDKVYYAARKAQKCSYQKAYRAANKEMVSAREKKYKMSHKKQTREYFAKYRETHREKINAYSREYKRKIAKPIKRGHWLLQAYGITLEEFNAMLESQGGSCAICKKSTWPINGPHLDHDHVTGRARGVLCHTCNSALGMIGDSPEIARAMADYLESAKMA